MSQGTGLPIGKHPQLHATLQAAPASVSLPYVRQVNALTLPSTQEGTNQPHHFLFPHEQSWMAWAIFTAAVADCRRLSSSALVCIPHSPANPRPAYSKCVVVIYAEQLLSRHDIHVLSRAFKAHRAHVHPRNPFWSPHVRTSYQCRCWPRLGADGAHHLMRVALVCNCAPSCCSAHPLCCREMGGICGHSCWHMQRLQLQMTLSCIFWAIAGATLCHLEASVPLYFLD